MQPSVSELNSSALRRSTVSNTNLSCEDFLFRHIGRNMFQIKVDVEGNEITDQAATAAVSEKKEKNQQLFISV